MKHKKEGDGRHRYTQKQPPASPVHTLEAPQRADRSSEDEQPTPPAPPQTEKKRPNWPLILSALTFVAIAAQACILWKQTGILDEQRQDTFNAGKITKAIAMYTEQYAVSMKANVAQANAALAEAKAQNRKSLEQSRKALDRTIEISRTDQRAWVGPLKVSAPELKAGVVPTVWITFQNSGKTPARSIRVKSVGRLFMPNERFWPDYTGRQDKLPPSLGTLFPQAEARVPAHLPDALSQHGVDSIGNGTVVLYVYGRVTYEDAFGQPHWTTYAIRYIPPQAGTTTLPAWRDADSYNTAN
jgi:hypothetical protein